MTRVVSIVEGDGEVLALPILLRRIGAWLTPHAYIEVLPPIRVHKDRFLNRPEEFSRFMQLASAKCQDNGWILVLLDADDHCPAELGAEIKARVQQIVAHREVSVVIANREYEAWFIASATSLVGNRGFNLHDGDEMVDPEVPRNAKGWMRERMGWSYSETTDQPGLSAAFDLQLARERSRSFRKLCSEWLGKMNAAE